MTKKLLLATLLVSLISFFAKAQDTVYLQFNPQISSAPVNSTVLVGIEAQGIDQILAFQLEFEWDSTVLELQNPLQTPNPLQNVAAPFTSPNNEISTNLVNPGYFATQWVDAAHPATYDGIIFEIPFKVLKDSTTQLTILNNGSSPIFSGLNGQSVVVYDTASVGAGGTDLGLSINNVSTDMGSDTCVSVTVSSNFIDITKLNFSLDWDETIAQYANLSSSNTTLGLSASNFDMTQTSMGQLGFTYSGSGIDLNPGEVLFSACFTGIGAEGSSTPVIFGDDPDMIVVENSGGGIAHNFSNGSFSINQAPSNSDTLFLNIPDVVANNGDNVCFPVTVESFNQITNCGFSLEWNTSVVAWDTVQNIALPGFNFSEVNNGKLGYLFFDLGGIGNDLSDGETLFELCLDVIGSTGSTSDISFIDQPIQMEAQDTAGVSTNEFLILDVTPGSIAVVDPVSDTFKIFSQPTDCTRGVNVGDTIAIDLLVEDFNQLLSFDAKLLYDNSKLTYLSALQDIHIPYDNIIPFVNNSGSDLTFIWLAPNATEMDWPDSTSIVTLYFQATGILGDDVSLNFDHTKTSASTTGNITVPALAYDIPMEITAPISVSPSITNASCGATSDGAISIVVSGATGNYEYLWNGPGVSNVTTQNLSNLEAGTYSLMVTSCNETYNTTYSVTSGAPFNLSITNFQNEATPPGDNGSVTALADGMGTYTYIWNGGAYSGASISGLDAGTYTVVADDGQGCTATNSVSLSNFSVSGALVHPTCFGSQDGSITLTVNGGSTPFTYNWNNGLSGAPAHTGLGEGSYEVTVTDATGAAVMLSFVLTEPDELEIVLDNMVPASGGNSDGALFISVSGGTPGYSYNWTGNVMTEDLQNVGVGSYTVTVTDDNMCTAEATYSVNSAGVPNPTVTSSDATCNGADNGTITITSITSGNSPYTITGLGTQNTDGTTPVLYSNLAPGSYSFTITDDTNADTTFSITINQPTPIQITNVVVTHEVSPPGNNGGIDITVAGGTSPYSYEWQPGNIMTQDVVNAPSGTYDLTITDDNGCTLLQAYIIQSSNVPVPTVSVEDVDCFGGSGGSISITSIQGSNPNYTVTMNGGNTQVTNGSVPVHFLDLTAGTYLIEVTDNNGLDTTFDVTVQQPLQVNITDITVECEMDPPGGNGSIDITINGGTPTYSVSWTGGYTTEDIFGLAAGDYTPTIVDSKGCVRVGDPITVCYNAAPFNCSTVATDTDCPDSENGSVILNVTGGTTPIVYKWTKNGVDFGLSKDLFDVGVGLYQVTVTEGTGNTTTCSAVVGQTSNLTASSINILSDYNGYHVSGFGLSNGQASISASNGILPYQFEWSTGEVGSMAQLLPGGELVDVTITDSLGCAVVADTILTVPNPVNCSITTTDVTCFGGSDGAIDLTVTGGVTSMNYNFSWDPNTLPANEDHANVEAGLYQVTVTDANGNTTSCDAQVGTTSNVNLSIDVLTDYNGFDVSSADAADGSAIVQPTGGVAPYSYEWDNGDLNAQADTLRAGVRTVTVTDAVGCEKEISVTLTAPGVFSCSTTVTDTDCPNSSNGAIEVNLSGGVSPFSYDWTGPGGPHDDTPNLMDLFPGTYDVTVTDANGNSTVCSGKVEQTSGLEAIVIGSSIVSASSSTSADGGAEVVASSGVAPYTYEWVQSNETTSVATQLPSGSNMVIVTDAIGCSVQLNVVIPTEGEITFDLVGTDATCYGVCDGSAEVLNLSGVSGTPVFEWTVGGSNSSVDELCAGDVSVTITDSDGKMAVRSVTISQPDSISISFDVSQPTGVSSCDGRAVATVTGGQGSFEYIWNDGNPPTTTNTLYTMADRCEGAYLLIVKDENNCTAMGEVIFVLPEPDDCFGDKLITPDVKDGSNDYFDLTCRKAAKENRLQIFNRWGQLVYSVDDYDGTWDGDDKSGNPLPQGAYFWIFSYTTSTKEVELKGHLSILR